MPKVRADGERRDEQAPEQQHAGDHDGTRARAIEDAADDHADHTRAHVVDREGECDGASRGAVLLGQRLDEDAEQEDDDGKGAEEQADG